MIGQANRVINIFGNEDPTALANMIGGAEILEGSLSINFAACFNFELATAVAGFPTLYSVLENSLSSIKEIRGYLNVRAAHHRRRRRRGRPPRPRARAPLARVPCADHPLCLPPAA